MGWAVANLCKPTLYDLFEMHAQGRGRSLVVSPDEADTKFGLNEGTITAFDTDKIMSEFMPDVVDQPQATFVNTQ